MSAKTHVQRMGEKKEKRIDNMDLATGRSEISTTTCLTIQYLVLDDQMSQQNRENEGKRIHIAFRRHCVDVTSTTELSVYNLVVFD